MSDTATRMTASGKTGGLCSVSGPYTSTRSSIVVFFKKGDKFSADPTDGKATNWVI